MTLPSWRMLWPFAALVALVILGTCYGAALRNAGALRQQIKQDEGTVKSYRAAIVTLGSRIPKVDTVAGKAKTVYTRAKVDYRKIRDSITAELAARGESPPPLIRACDAALAAADTALGACGRQVAIRDSLLALRDTLEAAQDSLVAHLKRRSPFLVRIGKPLIPFTLGAIAGAVASHQSCPK